MVSALMMVVLEKYTPFILVPETDTSMTSVTGLHLYANVRGNYTPVMSIRQPYPHDVWTLCVHLC